MKVWKPITKIVGWRAEDLPVKCPWCGSTDMSMDRESVGEQVICDICNKRTDLYEATKQVRVGE